MLVKVYKIHQVFGVANDRESLRSLRPGYNIFLSDSAIRAVGRSQLHLDVKTGPASATARRIRIINDLELRTNELLCKVDLTSLQEIQGWLVENDPCSLWGGCRACVIRNELKNRVVLVDDGGIVLKFPGRESNEAHEILKSMATTAFDLDS